VALGVLITRLRKRRQVDLELLTIEGTPGRGYQYLLTAVAGFVHRLHLVQLLLDRVPKQDKDARDCTSLSNCSRFLLAWPQLGRSVSLGTPPSTRSTLQCRYSLQAPLCPSQCMRSKDANDVQMLNWIG